MGKLKVQENSHWKKYIFLVIWKTSQIYQKECKVSNFLPCNVIFKDTTNEDDYNTLATPEFKLV